MKPLKIAIMTMSHGHTRKYFQVLMSNSNLEWVAASACDEKIRENFLNKVKGIPCYLSDEEMLNKHPEIEAVIIASENNRHLEQMKMCADRGIHILSMKIPTFDMDEYDQMIDLVHKSGIVCQVELELHYNPVVKRLKELYKSEELGKILSFQATNI